MGLLGIGDGKIEISLKSLNVAVGGKLEGTATLTLNGDVKAKGIVATLYATKRIQNMNINIGNVQHQRNPHQSNVQILYTKDQVLDTEKTYLKSASPIKYSFSFDIPEMGVPAGPQLSQGMENALKTVASIASAFGATAIPQPVNWYVKVVLKHEAMLSVPIEKIQEINVTSGPTSMQM